jgi:hypothetical protein
MTRPALEVADIFRGHGPAWRDANRGHVSLDQLKVMSAIESCRTAALGGHVARCEDCAHTVIAYNSCRNRHCPKCQGAAAREWMAAREAELLPVAYFHVVFTLPSAIGDIAYHNKAVIYDLLFKASAETMLTIAADPKHLGARIGITLVLHTWGSAMTHHPHIHMIVPGGGLARDGCRWKDYRIEGPGRYTTMTLDVGEFIRRFLIHVLPKGFHRIRHYGLFAGSNRAETIEHVRKLLNVAPPAADASAKAQQASQTDEVQPLAHPCPCCGGRMFVIEIFGAGCQPRHRPTPPLVAIRIDTS